MSSIGSLEFVIPIALAFPVWYETLVSPIGNTFVEFFFNSFPICSLMFAGEIFEERQIMSFPALGDGWSNPEQRRIEMAESDIRLD